MDVWAGRLKAAIFHLQIGENTTVHLQKHLITLMEYVQILSIHRDG